MTTAAAIHATEVIPNAVSLVQDIPLSRIQESKTNPRRQFDETRLAELADNIRLYGVLQPILVHPLPSGEAESYELGAGGTAVPCFNAREVRVHSRYNPRAHRPPMAPKPAGSPRPRK
jgi:ParB-like nuclease domain